LHQRVKSAGALALGLAMSGCPGAPAEKSEAAAVSRAVNSLREADNQKKRDFVSALRETPCTAADICAVRSECLAAYELHVDVLARMNGALGKNEVDREDVGALEQMKKDLARSRDLAQKCTDAQGEMIRRYKL
jgi:hypothetical protein